MSEVKKSHTVALVEALSKKVKSICPRGTAIEAWDDKLKAKIDNSLNKLQMAVLIGFPNSKAIGDPQDGDWETEVKITMESNPITRRKINSFVFAEKLNEELYNFNPEIEPEDFPYSFIFPSSITHGKSGNNFVHTITVKAKFSIET